MQWETVHFTQTDLAKYPFLKETAEHMKKLGLSIEELESADYEPIVKRAAERLENAVLKLSVGERTKNNEFEITSFPIAIMLALATKNGYIKKRYALAEAKQAYSQMQIEPAEKLLALAMDFGWSIEPNKEPQIPHDFSIGFPDYLRNVTHLKDAKWKLVNRLLTNGRVYLNRQDVARLLQEEIKRRIEQRLEVKELPEFPPKIEALAQHILDLAKDKIGEQEMDGFPKVILREAFPPCINALYEAATKHHHLSHMGRFALTSFLVTVGMSTDDVVEIFRTVSDFNIRLTKYQVEHIAGGKGSGTKYTPPNCATLQTHGVCVNRDSLCRRVYHPLTYYKRKQRFPLSQQISQQHNSGRRSAG